MIRKSVHENWNLTDKELAIIISALKHAQNSSVRGVYVPGIENGSDDLVVTSLLILLGDKK